MRILGTVSYKGTHYQGWQKQNDVPTIQKEIEERLGTIFNTPVEIYASGRTDAGVHAKNQTFHFDISKEIDLDRLCFSLNRMLPEDIKILSLKKVSDDFHARFSAKSKTYLYKIRLSMKDPFDAELKYVFPFKFDYNLFKKSCILFKGKHDFKDFTSKEEDEDNFIREIYSVEVDKKDEEVSVSFTGNGFMRYQIRDMVGTALAIASGQEKEDYILKHLDSDKPRDIVNFKAPSEGLYLLEVNY